MDFTYDLEARIEPQQGSRGESLKLTASFANIQGSLRTAYLAVPDYDIWQILRKTDEGSYVLEYTVPYEAPIGRYKVQVYGVSEANQRGPVKTLDFTVVA